MEDTGVVSCHRFNGDISLISSGNPYVNPSNILSSDENAPDVLNGGHMERTRKTTKSMPTAYDEDFEANGDEEVTTPRTSPTLMELRKMLDDFKSIAPKNSRLHERTDTIRANSSFILRSLKEVASRPCQYPLEKFYDEAIPVRSLQRPLIKGSLLTHDKTILSDKTSVRNRPVVSYPSVRRLDSVLTSPGSPLPRLSSYCSSSGSLIGNMNGIPLSEDNLFLSDSLFPPTLSKSLFDESKDYPSVSNGYADELHLNADSDVDKCEAILHQTNRDNESEDSGILTPSDDASSPGTTYISDKTIEPVNSSNSCSSKVFENNQSQITIAMSSDAHLSLPTTKSSRRSSKSKHSKRSKPSSLSYSQQPEQNNQKPICDQQSEQTKTLCDVTSSVQNPTSPCSTPSLNTIDERPPTPDIGEAASHNRTVSSCASRSASASSRANIQEDTSVDGDFTLVTNKKNKRKLKLEKRNLECSRTPNSPTPVVSSLQSCRNKPSAVLRVSSSTQPRGPFRKSYSNVISSYHKSIPTSPADSKGFVETNHSTAPHNHSYYRTLNSTSASDGASISGQSDRSIDSYVPRPYVATAQPSVRKTAAHCPYPPKPSLSQNRIKPQDAIEHKFDASRSTPISAEQHQTLARFLMSAWTSFAAKSLCPSPKITAPM